MTPLYTIGYERSGLERFVETLWAGGVRQLLDIRRLPLSRKPGFAKKALGARLAAEGIAYVHLVELGTPPELRAFLKAERDYPQFFVAYRAYLAGKEDALAAAGELVRASPSALFCFERDPRECHRLAVAEALCARDPELEPIHLEVPAELGAGPG
ncbi:MAG TPA: DUF488 domain-containing protein [Herpetosiphonaceae bacterium]